MTLTHTQRHALRDLVDELVAATDDHVFWLGSIRETSLELHALLTGHDDSESPTVEPVTANWKCPAPGCRFSAVNPMGHPCPL